MNTTVKQTGQSAGDLARKIARQIAQEPLEVLKTAKVQVTIPEAAGSGNSQVGQIGESQQKDLESQQKIQDKMKTTRRMEALAQELKDIHKQDLFKDLQNKIAQGIEVPLEDYPGLSMEQKQVLRAQAEAVKYQKKQAEYNQARESAPVVGSKPGRRFGQGQKREAERQQTRVEKPIPPSG